MVEFLLFLLVLIAFCHVFPNAAAAIGDAILTAVVWLVIIAITLFVLAKLGLL